MTTESRNNYNMKLTKAQTMRPMAIIVEGLLGTKLWVRSNIRHGTKLLSKLLTRNHAKCNAGGFYLQFGGSVFFCCAVLVVL